jgi:hypothetical protein
MDKFQTKMPVPDIPDATPDKTWPYRLFSAAFETAEKILPAGLQPSLTTQSVIKAAKIEPSPLAREGLNQLTRSLRAESALSLFGKVSVHWDLVRLLRNAAMIDRAHQANPALGERPIEKPLFILGLPRSGTTFLHALLAEDPENLVPRAWQTLYPAPRPVGFNPARHKPARTVDKQLNFFAGLTPEFPLVHPISADSPQECSEITSHVFQSLRFDTTFRVPSYLNWLDNLGHDDAFAFHKRFLQFLQNGVSARGWVLKCPDHTFSLDAILRAYPDARFVIVHRDPVRVFASVAHLTEVLRRPFLTQIDPAEIGTQVSSRWIEGASALVEFDQRPDIDASRKVHVHYDELVADPIAAVQKIYAQFAIKTTPLALACMDEFLAAKPAGGYARHKRYSISHFGIKADALRRQFAPYTEHFHINPGNQAAV